MTRNALLETIQKALPIKLELDYIAVHIDNAFTDALPAIYKLFPAVVDQYCTGFQADVAHVGNDYYCVLPSKILQFPFPGSGVRSVDPLEDRDIIFTPGTFESIRIQKNLEIGGLASEVDYYTDVDRVNFSRKPGDNISVRLRLLVPISAKEEDDDIFLPPGAVNEIVKAAMNYALATPPVKESNDQSGKQM